MTRQTHLQVTSLILLMTVIIDAGDAKRRDIGKMIRSSYAAKFLITAYKSKIVRFKMDEGTLQRRIYFLAFVESPEMIFHSTKKLVKYF